MAAADWFVGPEVDIERMTVLEPGDLLTAVEAAVQGQAVTAETAGQVVIRGVKPLAHNGYKVALLKNLVTCAIRGAER